MSCPQCGHPIPPQEECCPSCGAIQQALAAGTRLHQRYVIVQPLRREGGLSYLARDEGTQAQVLVHEFFPRGARRLGPLAVLPQEVSKVRQRWQERVHTWRSVTGDGVQHPHAFFEQHGTGYAVTSLPLGETLQARVQGGRRLTPAEATSLLLALAQALGDLHRQGGPDGQLGPGRLTLTAGGGRLDLGWGEDAAAAYRAPEQFLAPGTVTKAADLYALTAVILFGLTGEPPPSPERLALGQPLPPLPAGTPEVLRQTLTRGLARSVSERFPDAGALVRFLQGGEVSTGGVRFTAKPKSVQPTVVRAHQSWLTHLDLDDHVVVTAGADFRVRCYDHQGTLLQTLNGLNGSPIGVHLGESGIVAGDVTGTVGRWEGTHFRSAEGMGRLRHLAVRAGRQIITTTDASQLRVWELETLRALHPVTVTSGAVAALHVTADDAVLCGTGQGQLLLLEEQTLLATPVWSDPQGRPVCAIASGSGSVALAVGRVVTLFQDGAVTALPELSEEVSSLAVGGDGTQVVAGGVRGGLYLAGSGQSPKLLHRAGGKVLSVRWHRELLAIGTERGELLLLPVPGGH